MKSLLFFLTTALLFMSSAVAAQMKIEVSRAELAVPFGTVQGKAVLIEDYLIFIDDDQPALSFGIARSGIQNITADGGMVHIETRQPIRDRSGERSRFSLRPTEGGLAILLSWSRMTPGQTAAAGDTTGSLGSDAEQIIYQARHNHRIGSCNGRLIINNEMIAYESTNNIQDSRRWQFKDIKDIRQRNPYEIEIDPFAGSKYRIYIEGSGMDGREFASIVDRVTAARIAR